MTKLRRYLFSLILFLTFFCSCEKDRAKHLEPFYKLKVNGHLQIINACGSTDYVAQYLKDTAVFVSMGCSGQRAGFYLKGLIKDGSYQLDNINRAWYDEGATSYETDNTNTGTLTITSKLFQNVSGGQIPIVEGSFSFKAIDKSTGQTITVTSGQFLLKKYQY